jgi:hypothetical protein
MERILGIIGVVLALVFVGAVVLTSYQSGERDAKKNVALFEIAPERVDRIRIEGPDGSETIILRSGAGWILPDLGDFPADAVRVKETLDRLLLARRVLAVGSGAEAQREYKVADDTFERRLTLSAGDSVLTTVYLGSPQGPRQSHARLAGDAEVYAIAFGLYDAEADAGAWIDRNLLQVPEAEIAAIEVNGLHIVHDATRHGNAAWQLDAAASDQQLDGDAAARLAGQITALRIEGIRDTEAEPDYGLDDPQLSLTVTRRDGTRIAYRLGQSALQQDWSLVSSMRPEHFRLSGYSAHRLIDATRRDVLLAPAKSARHAAASGN